MRTLLAIVSAAPSTFDVNPGPEPGASAKDSERYSSRYAKLCLRDFMSGSLPGGRILSTTIRTLAMCGAISAILCCGSKAATEGDRLTPIDPAIGTPVKDYRPLLRRKLRLKPRTFARILYLPFGSGEAAVSIYRAKQRSERRTEFCVVYTKAEKDLWAKRMEGRVTTEDPGASAASIKVSKLEAPLPASTAHAVHEAWLSMLRPDRMSRPAAKSSVILDGSATEFFVDDGRHALQGALPERAVAGDALSLLRIGQLLIAYCEADLRRRGVLAGQIERKSKQLVASVQR